MEPHGAVLMVVSDVATHGVDATLQMVRSVCARARPGSVIVQLRDRELADGERLRLGLRLRELTRGWQQWLSVNERVDLALLVGADALHLPGQAPEAARIRGFLEQRGARLWLSAAYHDDAPAVAAVDAWVVAPVLAERKGRAALGLAGLRRVIQAAEHRIVFALGGIGNETAADCVAAGARVAVIGAAYQDPEGIVDALGLERRRE